MGKFKFSWIIKKQPSSNTKLDEGCFIKKRFKTFFSFLSYFYFVAPGIAFSNSGFP